MPKVLFTRQNASEMGKRSAVVRANLQAAEKNGHLPNTITIAANGHATDTIPAEITQAFRDTLRSLKHTRDAKERSLLSKSLRDLRETWHLVTGVPKPGVRKLPIERPARLMLSPAVDAGHAQTLATPTQASQLVSEPPSDIPPAENS